MHQEVSAIQYKEGSEWKNAKCDLCLHQLLGDTIDIFWNLKTGKMRVCKSEAHHELLGEDTEVIRQAHFRHSSKCPLTSSQFQKYPERDVKPCACVLLIVKDTGKALMTKRAMNMSFAGAWVLPGGHLEANEGIFQGGFRECQQEVGLPILQMKNDIIRNDEHVMVWESVFTEGNKIRRGGLVIFFAAYCPQFEVKMLESQVIDYKWKDINDASDEIPYDKEKKEGYAEGHRVFLNILRASPKS